MTGRIVDKVRQMVRFYQQIKRETKKGIRASTKIDRLKKSLGDIEKEIDGDIDGYGRQRRPIEEAIRFGGKSVPAIVLNYCFRNFHRIMGKGEYPTVLDVIPRVLDFMQGVQSLKEHQVLSIDGGDCLIGRISGPAEIDHHDVFYNLMIPVEKESFFRLQIERARQGVVGRWVEPYELKEGKPEIVVNRDLFGNWSRGNWRQGEMSYNRNNPQGLISDADLFLYLGDGRVQERFRADFVIPQVKFKAKLPISRV